MKKTLVLGITGASGAVYAARLLEVLVAAGAEVHLCISPAGRAVIEQELGVALDLARFNPRLLVPDEEQISQDSKLLAIRSLAGEPGEGSHVLDAPRLDPGKVLYHHHQDFLAPIASGSYLTDGMVVCPCSGTTASAIAHGTSDNLIHRAADVHLKERRKLVLVPRETPLSTVQLENLRLASQAGAVVLPAMPGFYHGARTVGDLVDFVVARVCDQLGIRHALMRRWGEPPGQ